jgi:hypothetical protein
MRVKVLANNVTISRSRIAAADYYTVNTSDPPTTTPASCSPTTSSTGSATPPTPASL